MPVVAAGRAETSPVGQAEQQEDKLGIPQPDEQPEKLEKSDEVPSSADDVKLDSTAIPSGSLADDDSKEEASTPDKDPQVGLPAPFPHQSQASAKSQGLSAGLLLWQALTRYSSFVRCKANDRKSSVSVEKTVLGFAHHGL